MKKLFITILFLIFFIPSVSLAADIFFSGSKDNYGVDEQFLLRVVLDTKGASINAVEGKILFPADFLELKEIRDGNSFINFWVEKPQSTKNGEITFSGIVTGGIEGENHLLLGLVFNAKKVGNGSVFFNNMRALANDGLGTKVILQELSHNFSISLESTTPRENLKILDTEPPEDFKPFIASDPEIFDGQYFLVFSAIDKGVGIDYYKVSESFWGPRGEYFITESPYLLKDQKLRKNIYIKAVDKAGNTRLVKIPARNPSVWLETGLIFGIITLILCILIFNRIWSRPIRR